MNGLLLTATQTDIPTGSDCYTHRYEILTVIMAETLSHIDRYTDCHIDRYILTAIMTGIQNDNLTQKFFL